MDLNYLFYRQQVERSMAEAASSELARKAHLELASAYEAQIVRATEAHKADDARPLFKTSVARANLGEAPKVNATMALAMTGREFAHARTA